MRKIILASSSPRRREILSQFNIEFEIIESKIEEKICPSDEPKQVAMSLAFQKAYDIANKFGKGEIIIAADTIVYKDSILGKPKNKIEALEMLKSLNGEEHSVITGIAIIEAGTDNKIVDYEETRVKFRNLTHEKIMRYIEMEECFDKAGSYGIQGYGALLVEGIVGSYTNVVGLPITKLDSILESVHKINII